MAAPRRDTRGILDPDGLLSRLRFRRREPAAALRPYLEHYWLIDWDLPRPYTTSVLPHPSVNAVFQPGGAELSGIGTAVFRQELTGRGWVVGTQFRPGGFAAFDPDLPVSVWTGRRVPLTDLWPDAELPAGDDDTRVAALDALLLAHGPHPHPDTDTALRLAELVRHDRTITRVDDLAAHSGRTVRALQRLFSARVGVPPKWVILRYRIHEALEAAERPDAPDWSRLAADLGYSDHAHLTRAFTRTVGVPPSAYAAR
ncbi:DUF6597 domain-containing transcriptional factor [Kitasatospora sp. NPDC059795]|uniref:DUF6597 domain-containing transcriptional factor n=1 Tax=Kitasatospora sp. NPDC059795 TaxID=3346949 RepID=UPI00364C11B5